MLCTDRFPRASEAQMDGVITLRRLSPRALEYLHEPASSWLRLL